MCGRSSDSDSDIEQDGDTSLSAHDSSSRTRHSMCTTSGSQDFALEEWPSPTNLLREGTGKAETCLMGRPLVEALCRYLEIHTSSLICAVYGKPFALRMPTGNVVWGYVRAKGNARLYSPLSENNPYFSPSAMPFATPPNDEIECKLLKAHKQRETVNPLQPSRSRIFECRRGNVTRSDLDYWYGLQVRRIPQSILHPTYFTSLPP